MSSKNSIHGWPLSIKFVLWNIWINGKNASFEEGNTTLRKEALASDFIWTEKPLELLGTITSIGFNNSGCATIKDHELTTDEVCPLFRLLLGGLPYTVSCILVLNSYAHIPGKIAMRRSSGFGKTGLQVSPQVGLFTLYRHAYLFRISHTCMWWLYTISCFRWRLAIRKDLSEKGSAASQKEVSGEDLPAKDEDEDILNEMSELKDIMDAKKKREKKAAAKRKAKVCFTYCISFSIWLLFPSLTHRLSMYSIFFFYYFIWPGIADLGRFYIISFLGYSC